MKVYLLAPTIAACAALWTLPLAAHHNSPMNPDIPDNAEEVHNAAIEAVLDRLETLGVTGMMNGTRATDMDPADSAAGSTCALVDDCDAGPGSPDDAPGLSYQPTERGPHL